MSASQHNSTGTTIPSHKAVRILIVDNHELIRRAVCQLFRCEAELVVCGEATDGKQAVEQFQTLKPDAVILDVSMPVMNGFDVAREIKRLAPQTKVVILTLYDLNHMRDQVRLAGIDGYVAKMDAAENLLKLVRFLT